MTLMFGPGWQAHLDVLAGRLRGGEVEPFWDAWSRLKLDYAHRFAARSAYRPR